MIKIIITDDHEIIRAGVKGIISKSDEIVVEDEARDGQELLEKIRKKKFDVVLLDITMPGRSGIEILKQIKIEYPDLPVLMLSSFPEEQYAVRALKAGAAGYLNKKTVANDLLDAIIKVNKGKKYISPVLAEMMADLLTHDSDKPVHERLTDREFQIYRMIASGMTLSEIAKELFLSVKTISVHRQKILQKTGLKNNAELTHYAITNHILD